MKPKSFICFLVLGVFIFYSCKKENTAPPETTAVPFVLTSSLAGFGDRPGTPSVVPFLLPKDIAVTSPITNYDSSWQSWCGIGTVGAYFTLSNYSHRQVNVTFPAGLVLIPDNDSSQCLMTCYPTSITLPPLGSKNLAMRFFCMNHHKVSNYANFYTIAGISNNDQVNTLTNLLQTKSYSTVHEHAFFDLQPIVWHITDSTGLTQADIDSISLW